MYLKRDLHPEYILKKKPLQLNNKKRQTNFKNDKDSE